MAVESPKEREQKINYNEISLAFNGNATITALKEYDKMSKYFYKQPGKEKLDDQYEKQRQIAIKYIMDNNIKPYCDNTTRVDVQGNDIVYMPSIVNFENMDLEGRKTMGGKQIGVISNGIPSIYTDFGKVVSSNTISKTLPNGKKMTYCSTTAQTNAKKLFGITIPSGNSRVAVNTQPIDNTRFQLSFVPENTSDPIPDNLGSDINFADLLIKSTTPNGKKFGHRAVAFKEKSDNKRYILDPYFGHTKKPLLLETYAEKHPILKANFYISGKQPIKKEELSV